MRQDTHILATEISPCSWRLRITFTKDVRRVTCSDAESASVAVTSRSGIREEGVQDRFPLAVNCATTIRPSLKSRRRRSNCFRSRVALTSDAVGSLTTNSFATSEHVPRCPGVDRRSVRTCRRSAPRPARPSRPPLPPWLARGPEGRLPGGDDGRLPPLAPTDLLKLLETEFASCRFSRSSAGAGLD
mgnify:CR=1 FL=1